MDPITHENALKLFQQLFSAGWRITAYGGTSTKAGQEIRFTIEKQEEPTNG